MFWALGGVAALAAFWFISKRLRANRDIVALVMLLEAPRLLTMPHIETALAAAGASAETPKEEQTSYFRLWVDGFELTIAGAPMPYLQPSQIGLIMEARLRDVAERHTGCLLIDCWGAPEGKQKKDSLPLLGKLMAEFVEESCLAIYSTVSQRVNLITPELVERLRAGEATEVMEEMAYDGIGMISGDDPALHDAVDEARKRWPEFVDAWNAAEDKSMFVAKFPFTEGDECEYMWINPTSIDADTVNGRLMNKPFKLRRLREGHEVSVSISDLNDWLAVIDGEPVGAFTETAVRAASAKA